MITEIKMFGCTCDNCDCVWESGEGFIALIDKNTMSNTIDEEGEWHTNGDKHYCEDCFSFDEEDNLILKDIKNENYKIKT